MNPHQMFDSELNPLLDLMPSAPMSSGTLAERRQVYSQALPNEHAPAIAPMSDFCRGRDGAPDVPLLIFDPPRRSGKAVILYIHGGGMVVGTAWMNAALNAELAQKHDCLVVSVGYRLPPECPFPGPQKDCYAALDWLRDNAGRLDIDMNQIVVMGHSAGGGLSAALAQMARDRGEYRLRGQVLIYPMLDHRTGSDECPYRNPISGHTIWTRSENIFGWQSMRGNYAVDDERAGWFSPSRARSFADLPHAFIATGTIDLFVDEDIGYAQNLMASGVPVELHVDPGAPHGFDWVAETPTSRYWTDFHRAVARMIEPSGAIDNP